MVELAATLFVILVMIFFIDALIEATRPYHYQIQMWLIFTMVIGVGILALYFWEATACCFCMGSFVYLMREIEKTQCQESFCLKLWNKYLKN